MPNLRPIAIDPGKIPDPRALGVAEDNCPGRQRGGRAAATERLESFLQVRGETYRKAMSSPVTGASACSRLSPHFAWGSLSMREAAQATWARQRDAKERNQKTWRGALSSFSGRLHWHCHFMQKLEDEPDLEFDDLHPAYKGLRPASPDQEKLAAWQNGETGLPFVDACMRSLAATGMVELPHALHGDGHGQLSPMAGLAGNRAASRTAIHRLRTRDPLAAGSDAVRHHRHQYNSDLQPRKAGV